MWRMTMASDTPRPSASDPVQTRTYDPDAVDLGVCGVCGETAQPFPDRESPQCSWCWWQRCVEAKA